jgi:hypothetical protein
MLEFDGRGFGGKNSVLIGQLNVSTSMGRRNSGADGYRGGPGVKPMPQAQMVARSADLVVDECAPFQRDGLGAQASAF